MKYTILFEPTQFSNCEPTVLKEDLEKVSKLNKQTFENTTVYLFHKHYFSYLWVKEADKEVDLSEVENLNAIFKEWLGNQKYNVVVRSAKEMFKSQINDTEIKENIKK